MIKALRTLFSKTPREHPVKKSAASAASKPSKTSGEHRAASLAPSGACCMAARAASGKRFLLRNAPRLPLANCTMPANCSCRFRKHADIRDGDRRMLGTIETSRWFAGSERRKPGGRRSTTS